MAAECVVSAKDYARYWTGEKATPQVYEKPVYTGKERRANAHDRRWYACGGRRRFDRRP